MKTVTVEFRQTSPAQVSAGTGGLYIRYYNGAEDQGRISLNIQVKKEMYQAKYGAWLSKRDPKSMEVNMAVSQSYARAMKIIELEGISFAKFKKALLSTDPIERILETRLCISDAIAHYNGYNKTRFANKEITVGTLSFQSNMLINIDKVMGQLFIEELDHNRLSDAREKLASVYSQSSLYAAIGMLRTVIAYCARKGYCSSPNPLIYTKVSIRGKAKEKDCFTHAEMRKIYEHAILPKCDIKLYMVAVSVFTGLRRSDLEKLERSRVQMINDMWYIQMETHKEKVFLSVPLAPEAKSLLVDYDRISEMQALHARWKKIDPTSPKYQGSHSMLNKYLRSKRFRDIVPADKRVLTPHSCRHSFGRYMLEKGFNMDEVQLFMGHRDVKSTQIYAKYRRDNLSLRMQQILGTEVTTMPKKFTNEYGDTMASSFIECYAAFIANTKYSIAEFAEFLNLGADCKDKAQVLRKWLTGSSELSLANSYHLKQIALETFKMTEKAILERHYNTIPKQHKR